MGVLPDHLQALWTLPSDDIDYPGRWRAIKSNFVRGVKIHGVAITMPADGSAILWQRRFWEHTIKMMTIYAVALIIVTLIP